LVVDRVKAMMGFARLFPPRYAWANLGTRPCFICGWLRDPENCRSPAFARDDKFKVGSEPLNLLVGSVALRFRLR
jgi:hypothetical protein